MLYYKIELKTDSRSLTKFLNAVVGVLKQSLMDEFIDDYTPRTVKFIGELCDHYINHNKTVKEWRHFIKNEECLDLDQFEERLETTKLYLAIKEMVLFSKMKGRNIINQVYVYDDLIVNGVKEDVEPQIHSIFDTFEKDILFIKELYLDLHWKVEFLYDRQNLNAGVLEHYKEHYIKYHTTVDRSDGYYEDLLDYIDFVYYTKCANKIQKFFLKNYYSPHTKMGKRRFNKELDKLESL